MAEKMNRLIRWCLTALAASALFVTCVLVAAVTARGSWILAVIFSIAGIGAALLIVWIAWEESGLW